MELKGRQQGSSTGIGAYCFLRTICEANTNCLVITEEKGGSAANVFGMYERYYNELPVEVERSYTRLGQFMTFGEPLHSSIRVEGEKNITSHTFQMVHCSEASFFQNLGQTMSMLFQTVPDNPDTFVCLETTANKFGDDFHTEWERAMEGKSDYLALFIPWFMHDEYQTPFAGSEEEARFEKQLSQRDDHEYGHERNILDLYPDLTLANMRWRRNSIRNRCQGSVAEFNRQYPCSPEDAFLKTSTTIFDLNYLSKSLKEAVTQPLLRGTMQSAAAGLKLEPDVDGIVHLYHAPEPYAEYVMGSDHAEGLDGRDYSAAIVMQRLPLRMVAKVRGYEGRQVMIDEFAEQMALLARYYNQCWVCPENNADGGSVILLMTEKLDYHNIMAERELGVVNSNRLGWRNQSNTRRRGVALLQEAVHAQDIEICDRQTLLELQNFHVVNGKPQAIKKGKYKKQGESELGYHDDLTFALIGALYAHYHRPQPKTRKYWMNALSEHKYQTPDYMPDTSSVFDYL